MGTWGYGLFDGDGPLDAVGDFVGHVLAKVDDLAAAKPSEANAARLGALIGVLLYLQESYTLEDEHRWEGIRAALERQAPASPALSAETCRIVRRVRAGDGPALANRGKARPSALKAALGGYLSGLREPALFAHPDAVRELDDLAAELARILDAELAGADDLYRVSSSLAFVALLLLLEPCWVAPKRWKAWRARIHALWEVQRSEDQDQTFWRKYLKNVDRAFALGAERFPSRRPKLPPRPKARRRPRAASPWFHLRHGSTTEGKFWSIARHDRGFTVHFGKVGTPGQERTTWFGSAEEAERQLVALLESKLAKGYEEDDAGAA
jgi:predicted DNA-binding WGR domain protein